jgi:hypothetical protein
MQYAKGAAVYHQTSGLRGSIYGPGLYSDTCVIEIPPEKDGLLPRRIEVYTKHLTVWRCSPVSA